MSKLHKENTLINDAELKHLETLSNYSSIYGKGDSFFYIRAPKGIDTSLEEIDNGLTRGVENRD